MSELTAVGPQGLIDTLTQLNAVPDSAGSHKHFIHYQNGSQRALLLVDTQQIPYEFFHYDLDGRAANSGFIRALADFCGITFKIQDVNSILHDVSRAHLFSQQKGFFEGGAMVQDQDERTPQNARRHLEAAYAKFEADKVAKQTASISVQSVAPVEQTGISRLRAGLTSLFGNAGVKTAEQREGRKLDNTPKNR